VRDTANNPVLQLVPAYKNDDANTQRAWEVLNPNDKYMNHCPTDAAIKSSVMLALGSSTFATYLNLAQQYRQNNHATNKTWNDLRMDIESNITKNTTGTSRDPDVQMRQRERASRDWRRSPSRFEQSSPLENRSSRTLCDAYHYDSRKRAFEQPLSTNPQDIRAATPTSHATTAIQFFPCANCKGDHRATECDSLKCFTCLATFPTAALRQAHYMSTPHRRDPANKRTRFAPITTPGRSQPVHTTLVTIPVQIRR
jgi:hypothetical protein